MSDHISDPMSINELKDHSSIIPALDFFADQIPGGFIVFRADGMHEIIKINGVALGIFGCKDTDEFKKLTGNTFTGLVYKQDLETVEEALSGLSADGAGVRCIEYRMMRKDGEIRWIEHYDRLSSIPGYGDVHYVFISDITERYYKQKENELRMNVYQGMVSQFNALADESLAVARTNLTTGITEDIRGCDLFDVDYIGCPVEDRLKARAESFLIEGDKERYLEIFNIDRLVDRYYKGEDPSTFVGFCRRQSGRKCFVKFTGNAVVDPITGDIIAFASETDYNTESVTDVLNQKVLVKQYDMVAYIIGDNYGVVIGDAENIKEGSIFPKEKDGIYTSYIRDEVLPALSQKDLVMEDISRQLSLSAVEEELEQNDSYTVDVTCDIGGKLYYKRFIYYVVDRKSKFYILLKSDISDVIRKEHEVNELLVSALQEAQNANAAKTTFLSNMSHEIRTPMNAIVGLNSIALQSPDLTPQTREYLKKIGASAKHLLSIINDILDMSRIESGRMSLKIEEFSFSDMLEQINMMIQSQCRDIGLTYECRVIGSLNDYYVGDDMKLKQVLINILGNAVKFTEPPGNIVFTIEQTAELYGNATLRFEISDTGIGMDEEYLPQIFDAFSQEKNGTSNKFGSTGLGMAITKNIVEMMNGKISVRSKKGVGSKFTVTVTLGKGRENDGRRKTIDPDSINVLVIDDDPIACHHAQLVLKEVGISADISTDGHKALEMIKSQDPDKESYNLILVDWKMPGIDGIELTRRIRSFYDGKATIIILTAYNWDDIMEEAVKAGVDSFMTKPLFASNILNELEKRLNGSNELIAGMPEVKKAELAGKHILLAEDIEINAEIMKNILGVREMIVDHAENGKLTLEKFENSPENYYDAILMDVRMPVMNGLEASAAIRALERSDAKTIPIIALTANAFDEDVKNSMQAGMNSHLSKPVDVDRLYEELEKLISSDK